MTTLRSFFADDKNGDLAITESIRGKMVENRKEMANLYLSAKANGEINENLFGMEVADDFKEYTPNFFKYKTMEENALKLEKARAMIADAYFLIADLI